MKIFITGGTGFIGKHLIERVHDEKLLILSHHAKPNLKTSGKKQIIQGSLANISNWKDHVKDFKPDATIHMAWEGIPDYGVEMSIKNLNYCLNLYRFLAEINCKTIISTGSCWEYGGQNGQLSEKTLVKPFNAFTASKNSLNFLGQEIAKENNINFIWTRLFYVYGPGQRSESLIPYLINSAKSGEVPEIKNLNAENDFVYVEDVADAILQLMLSGKKSTTYNIGSGKLTSVKYIVDQIFNYFNVKYKPKKAGAKQTDSLSSFYADISKINEEVGWVPKVNIDDGIKKTIESFL